MKHFGNSLSFEEILEDERICQQMDNKKTVVKSYKAETSKGELFITQFLYGNGAAYSIAKDKRQKTIAESRNSETSALRWLKTECKMWFGLWNERIKWTLIS